MDQGRSFVSARRRTVPVVMAAVVGLQAVTILPVAARSVVTLDRSASVASAKGSATATSATGALARLPMGFEANVGQSDPSVHYLARGRGYTVFITPDRAVLRLGRAGSTRPTAIEMRLAGASSGRLTSEGPLPGRVNHLYGSDPHGWRAGIQTYARIRSAGVYPGIDLVYRGDQRRLEYDFEIAPGADPSLIDVRFAGAERLEIDPSGDLLLHTPAGIVRQPRPFTFQHFGEERQEVESGFRLHGDSVRFSVGAYDRSRPLVIDPSVAYSSFLGGGADAEVVNGIAVDVTGNAYVTGFTGSADFPKTTGALDTSHTTTGGFDAFVTKVNADGTAIVYSTFLGGTGVDKGASIAVDPAGRAYVTGTTSFESGAPVFPHTPGALVAPNDFERGFVSVLDATGTGLIYSGTFEASASNGIAVHRASSGRDYAYVVGETSSDAFPTTAGAYDRQVGVCDPEWGTCGGGPDAFLMKLDPHDSANDLLYSTLLGGGESPDFLTDDRATAVAVDTTGRAYLTGATRAVDFPVKGAPTGGAALHAGPAGELTPLDAFVAKIDPSLSGATSLVYSSYLGGNGEDIGYGIDVDGNGAAYITGATQSTDFPRSTTAWDKTCGATGTCDPVDGARTSDAFVTRLVPAGNAYGYSTYLGGRGVDEGRGIALSAANEAFVTGTTESADFPLKDAVVRVHFHLADAFVSKLDAAGSGLLFSSYFGSTGHDQSNAIAVGPGGNAYVGGEAAFTDFPWSQRAFDPVCGAPGGADPGCLDAGDGFILRVSPAAPTDQCPIATSLAAAEQADPENVIVKFRADLSRDAGPQRIAAAGLERVRDLSLIGAHVVRAPDRSALELARSLARRPDVEYVTLDHLVRPMGYPDEPGFSKLWGLHNTGQPIESFDDFGTADMDIDGLEASRVTLGDPNLVVAVIDDGVDFRHPDLAGRAWRNPGESGAGRETNGRDDDGNGYVDDVFGWDFKNNDKTVHDLATDTHGTHVAGTIAANIDGKGIVGVAPQVRIMALKFLGGTAGGNTSHAIAAIQYAARKGVTIANNSWGGGACNPALKDAIRAASGMLFVAAAGNGGRDGWGDNNDVSIFYPASYDLPTVVSVAAVDKDGSLTDFSNWGYRNVDLGAPGAQVYSTIPGGGYAFYPGTSMAAPHVAGVAALVRSVNRSLTMAQVRQVLLSTGMPLASLKDRTATGRMVNARAAVDRAIALDVTAPSTVVPTHTVRVGTQLGTSTVPVTVAWPAATDTGTGVVRYELSESTDGGASWRVVATVPAATRAVLRQLTPGTTAYRYRVRAQDRKGNWSTFGSGPAFRVAAFQETPRSTSPTLVYSAGWSAVARSGAYGGAVRTSTTTGSTATFTFTGRQVAAVAPFRTDLGAVRACLSQGTTSLGCSTVDLSPATGLVPRKVFFARTGLTAGTTYRLAITVVSGRVDLDALVVVT